VTSTPAPGPADTGRQATQPRPGRQRNRRGEGERLRAEIVAAAKRLLADQPVDALSLRAVAREAGISPPALYLHFTDRRALVWAVLEDRFAELARHTAAAADAAADQGASGRLRAWCLAYCHYGLAHPGHYRLLFESWNAQRVELPLDQLPGHTLYQGALAVLRQAGVDEHDLRETATLLWAGLHGLVSLRINKPSFGWPPIARLVDGLLDRLIGAEPATRTALSAR
jgi:AcrR family transcriptional regulator